MKKTSVGKKYLINGHYFDFVLSIIIIITLHYIYKSHHFIFNEKYQDILSNLISGTISLTGFGLAALTIIITFRANYFSKNDDLKKPSNFLEFMIIGKSYIKISKIFKNTLIQFIISISIMYLGWVIPIIYENPLHILYLIIFGLICLIGPCMRILYTLFGLLNLENHSFSEKEE